MDFFKKLSETVMDTASTISAKSTDMVEMGKLKLQRNQLENAIKDKKTEIGNIIYQAQKQGLQPDESLLKSYFESILNMENEIEVVDEKINVQMCDPEFRLARRGRRNECLLEFTAISYKKHSSIL